MKIPSHWSKATAEGNDRKGRKVAFSCWRSSDQSPEEAHASALTAARRVLQKFIAGEPLQPYAYGGGAPLREDVVERFTDSEGTLFAAVTRNAYGSLVLNATRAMFIDVDFSPSPWEELKHLFARLFNRSAVSPAARKENEAIRRLEQWVAERPGWGVRVYRTAAGLRALVTHDLFDAASAETVELLESVGADPLYVRLCTAQQCFRARLTPKPWRCGHYRNAVGWPHENEQQQAAFRQWLAEYDARQAKYATCRFVSTLGSRTVHPEVETIIEIHDTVTRCAEGLELA